MVSDLANHIHPERSFLRTLSRADGLSEDEISEALRRSIAFVRSANFSNTSEQAVYSSVLRLTVDRIGAWVEKCSEERKNALETLFDTLFLEGPPEIGFEILTGSIRDFSRLSSSGAESADVESLWTLDACVHTLQLFTSRNLDGVARLVRVLTRGVSQGTIDASALIHLPSFIANHSMGRLNDQDESTSAEKQYYSVLAEALLVSIFDQAEAGNGSRIEGVVGSIRRTVSGIVGRLCVLGLAPLLIHHWCIHPKTSTEHVSSMILSAPVSACGALVKALVELNPSEEMTFCSHRFIVSTLQTVLQGSRTAADNVCYKLALRRPLVTHPRTTLLRMVSAVVQSGSGLQGVKAAAEVWASPAMAVSPDINLQSQVTRLLLLYLAALCHHARAAAAVRNNGTDVQATHVPEIESYLPTSVAVRIASGVSTRLSSPQFVVRRFGMVVGEGLSRMQHDQSVPLKFDRARHSQNSIEEDGYDSDLSELADLHWPDDAHPEQSYIRPEVKRESVSANVDETSSKGLDSRKNEPHEKSRFPIPLQEDTSCFAYEEDDWTSLESFEMSSDEDSAGRSATHLNDAESTQFCSGKFTISNSDYELVKSKLSSPFSAARTLSFFRSLNNGDEKLAMEPELVAAILRNLLAFARATRVQVRDSTVTGEGTMSSSIGRLDGFNSVRYTELSKLSLALCHSAAALANSIFVLESGRFPETLAGEIAKVRHEVMVVLACLDLESVGKKLVLDIFCNGNLDLSRRGEALSFLAEAVREYSSTEKSDNQIDSAGSGPEAVETSVRIGTVTRIHHRSLTVAKRREVDRSKITLMNKFSRVSAVLFYCLANSLDKCSGSAPAGHCSHDFGLLSQGIATAALILSRSGSESAVRMDMCQAMLELCSLWQDCESPVVRRSVALALGTVARTFDVNYLKSLPYAGAYGMNLVAGKSSGVWSDDVEGTILSWLKSKADGDDADVYVRQFALSSLRNWREKLSLVMS